MNNIQELLNKNKGTLLLVLLTIVLSVYLLSVNGNSSVVALVLSFFLINVSREFNSRSEVERVRNNYKINFKSVAYALADYVLVMAAFFTFKYYVVF